MEKNNINFTHIINNSTYNNAYSVIRSYYYDNDFLSTNHKKKTIINFIKRNDVTLIVPNVNDAINSLYIMNKMVKSDNCPSNIRNRFYAYKHKVIVKLFKNGYIDYIIESEKYYNFICGKYSFHQPKNNFTNIIYSEYIKGKEEYVNDLTYIKYNPDEFRLHFFNISYYYNYID